MTQRPLFTPFYPLPPLPPTCGWFCKIPPFSHLLRHFGHPKKHPFRGGTHLWMVWPYTPPYLGYPPYPPQMALFTPFLVFFQMCLQVLYKPPFSPTGNHPKSTLLPKVGVLAVLLGVIDEKRKNLKKPRLSGLYTTYTHV
jgi:hypothetical protein